jgi:hypothetical protein
MCGQARCSSAAVQQCSSAAVQRLTQGEAVYVLTGRLQSAGSGAVV